MKLLYIAVVDIPSSENIDNLKVIQGHLLRENPRNQISTISNKIYLKPRDAALNPSNFCQALQRKTLDELAYEFGAKNEIRDVFGDDESPDAPLILCFRRTFHELRYLAFAGIPTSQNLSTLVKAITQRHQSLVDHPIASFYKSRDALEKVAEEFSAEDSVYTVFGDASLPQAPLIVCFSGRTLHYLAFAGFPTQENIHTIQIVSGTISVMPNEELSTLTGRILEQHPTLHFSQARFFEPQSKPNEYNIRRMLERQDLAQAIQELSPRDFIHEAFEVQVDEPLSRRTLLVCFHGVWAEVVHLPSENTNEEDDIIRELEKQFLKYITAVAKGQTPSVAAKSANYQKNQNSSTTILLDGRFTESGDMTTALPVELYHPAFATFLFHATDCNVKIPVDVLRKTAELMRHLSLIVGSEAKRDDTYRTLLADILGTPIDTIVNPDKASSDFVSLHSTPLGASAAPHLGKIETEIGTSGSDPSIQASFSYASKLKKPEKPKQTRGNYIAPRFCPSITSYVDSSNATINFRYVKPLEREHTCVTFLAEILNGDLEGQHVVVKFVREYGVEAHRWMASHGFAPELIYHGPLETRYRGLALVVMEHVRGSTLHKRFHSTGLSQEVRDAVRTGLDKLAENNFVFGDLRTPNIMLADADEDVPVVKRLRFIDFDWACLDEGEDDKYTC
ncbi:hypothetical protein VNI00_015361 [Paramarasmius palmivorus]|uniref:Protein kinase domain-containing protein n=1 Tax=Paramarasmius palmivorus TaxID=297713 RepID=A0AAW0BLJ1_9AGAR